MAMIALLAEGTPRLDKVVTVPSIHPIVAKLIHNLNRAMLSMHRSFHQNIAGGVPSALAGSPYASRSG
jgi:hypothetical protein